MSVCIVNVNEEINRFYIPEDVDVWFWGSTLRIANFEYHFSQGFTESGSLSIMVSEIDFKNIVDSFK